MKLELPISLLEEIQICQDHLEESIEHYRQSQKIINEEHRTILKFWMESAKRGQEENVTYLEEHDWHRYKQQDWIQDLEESDWS